MVNHSLTNSVHHDRLPPRCCALMRADVDAGSASSGPLPRPRALLRSIGQQRSSMVVTAMVVAVVMVAMVMPAAVAVVTAAADAAIVATIAIITVINAALAAGIPDQRAIAFA